MASNPDNSPTGSLELPDARDVLYQTHAVIEARRASPSNEMAARRQHLETQFAAWLSEPLPPLMEAHVIELVRRAAAGGEFLAHVYRFPSEYCRDRGRAVNNGDSDWPGTLQGPAAAHFTLLRDMFEPRGFRIGAQVVTWPLLMPGDISLFLTWRD